MKAETLEDRLDTFVGLGVALDEGHAQTKIDVSRPDVRLDSWVEYRNEQTGDEAADEHDVGSHEPKGADDVSCFGGQLIGEVRVVAGDVLSVRFVQVSAP